MKLILAALVVLFVLLQFKLWVGDNSMKGLWQLQQAIEIQTADNKTLNDRNQALAAEVNDLKQGLEAIEERARNELGMIIEGETFYQVVN